MRNALDLSVDFGPAWFLSKPMFYVIDFFNRATGNFGVAILLLTICVRVLLFPLANKAYASMSRMRKLQPEMIRLRERYKDDKQRANTELMKLYREQKANPVAGCLPLLAQIPVFFALYYMLFVTIEMRHAPFFGWLDRRSVGAGPADLHHRLRVPRMAGAGVPAGRHLAAHLRRDHVAADEA